VAAYAARSFAAPLVLRTRENEMFAVRLYRFWHEGEPGPATAAGVLFLLAIVVMGLLGRLLIVRFSPQRTS
jgi:ABC-type Fe3+ transport system permease subunit